MTPLGWLAIPPLLLWLLNRGVRASLRAERMPRDGEPEGMPWEAVHVPSRNGKILRGWFIPAGPRTLIMMHGWGGNVATLLPLARRLWSGGFSLLMLDARCHGESDDDSFASLPRFAEDIEAGLAWLDAERGLDGRPVGLVGHSVGAGAALLAASRNPRVSAVVSLAAFAHPAAMMRRWLALRRIPYWPLGVYVLAYVQRVIGFRFDDIAPVNVIRHVRCPVMLVHGVSDQVVPLDEARAIRAAARGGEARLLEVEGTHEDFGDIDAHMPRLLAFLDHALPVTSG